MKTHWHRLLGSLLEQLLTPVGISVQCDIKVMVNPPEADILLLRRETPQWTAEQFERLPDGIRDCVATDILLEFKYTESVNETALQQTLSYDFFYKRTHHLSANKVKSFLISAKTPHAATLKRFSYEKTCHQGVYHSASPLLEHVTLIVLNELSNDPHNAWIKCFASRNLEKQKAFISLRQTKKGFISLDLQHTLSGLWRNWFNSLEDLTMNTDLTPEKIMEMGRFWDKTYLSQFNAKERLEGLNTRERLEGLNTRERLADLSTEEIECYLQQRKKLTN